jgi:hypothetical protein
LRRRRSRSDKSFRFMHLRGGLSFTHSSFTRIFSIPHLITEWKKETSLASWRSNRFSD